MFKNIQNIVVTLSTILLLSSNLWAEPVTEIPPDEKCPVCGMFVAKYQPWIAQLHYSDDNVKMFDGVKDMMAYYFEPEKYGGKKGDAAISIYVKEYYTQEWIDGKKAIFVTGSDVMGPMGHELIPFDSKEAAQSFVKDHKGKAMFLFDQITLEQVTALRGGMKMKGKKKMHDHGKHDHSG